jgi:copper(I)-binding protein
MNRMKWTTAALLMAGASTVNAELTIEDAWVRAMPPTQKMTAGYATITNSGDEAVTVAGASSPIAKMSELHTTVKDGDRMRMVPLDPVTLEPGQQFTFTPGGPHVMLMGVASMPSEGTEVEFCFEMADGSHACTKAPVSRGNPSGHGHHH